jgi:hypothetical protein
MKRIITSIVGLMILFAACKKNPDSNTCPHLGKNSHGKSIMETRFLQQGVKSWDDGLYGIGTALLRAAMALECGIVADTTSSA